MAYKSGTSTAIFNKHGLPVRWPRVWVIIIGLVLVFLTFAIAGMETGHTIYDVFRSTAFGGYIVFFPLLLCAIFVLITACIPKLVLLRVTVVLCCIMIFLCIVVIVYDVFVIVDPTRCFFLSCSYATITTGSVSVSGWPVSITWPDYFTTNMNFKRLFQSLQLLCASLYILFAVLYIVTYYIHRHVKLQQHAPYNVSRSVYPSHETNRAPERRTQPVASSPRPGTRTISRMSNHVSQPYTHLGHNHKVTVYTIEGPPEHLLNRYHTRAPSVSTRRTVTPTRSKGKTFVRPRASSVDEGRLCARCNREPRVVLSTHYERENYFSHLCVNCNNELSNEHQKAPHQLSRNSRHWIP
ncbi:unnamed protein product [Adineta ricciae]|uniref:Uncharacterized protein n=1 Tax=Adineta ricciae TaxID=249248 RepID=A0A815D0H7_ADIRI|nr:unnamed protein product [Adineta ricciae]